MRGKAIRHIADSFKGIQLFSFLRLFSNAHRLWLQIPPQIQGSAEVVTAFLHTQGLNIALKYGAELSFDFTV